MRLCGAFSQLSDPGLDAGPSTPLRGPLSRLAYQQFGFNLAVMPEVARSVGLLLDHAPGVRGAPSADEWERALGVPLETYMRVALSMYVAVVHHDGKISRELLRQDHVASIFEPVDVDTALDVVDRLLAATLDQQRAWAVERRVPGYELWSPNPLQNTPLIPSGGDFVGPLPDWILGRMTPMGLYFTGVQAFGRRFTDALGTAFEQYIGAHLRLVEAAALHPQAVFGSPERATVDWFVVTEEVVVLVEVKSARPVLATRAGAEGGDADVLAKIGHARHQIDATSELLDSDHPAVGAIPKDRPVRGLVVTLEPFHLIDTFLYEDVLPRTRVPTCTASAHEVEAAVAALAGRPDAGARLFKALTPFPPAPPALRHACDGLASQPNPLIESYWSRLSR